MNQAFKKDIFKVFLSLFLVIFALIVSNEALKIAILLIAYAIIGFEVIKKGLKTLKNGGFLDENFLMSIASIAAFGIGENVEAVAIMLFYKIGEIFEKYATNKSRNSIQEAMNLAPEFANLKQNGTSIKVDPNSIKIDDIILIKPGEKVPLDCVVLKGRSELDLSAITGESVPLTIQSGDEILSGAINLSALLEAKVTKTYENSTINRILELVEESVVKKSKSEKFITKFAKFYTPIVVFTAFILALIVPIFAGNFDEWLLRGIVFLVVSCPCALVISVPLSFFGAIGAAGKRGILIKGSSYIENLAKLGIIAFDKTGTLTKGKFRLKQIQNQGKISKDELLFYATCAQIHSTHPLAKAIVSAFTSQNKQNLAPNLATSIKEIPGKGVKAVVDNKTILVGNKKLLQNFDLPCIDETACFVAIDDEFAGFMTFEDEMREDTQSTISWLKNQNIKTAMLSGDKISVAQKIANRLNLDEFHAELLPQNKVEIFENLMSKKQKNATIAYIGDGINDAPVLARADVGIAMLGTDAAMEAGDIVLMKNELSQIKTAIEIARKTIVIAYQNIFFAIFFKISIMILAIFGVANIWLAIFGDVGITILAILNSFRTFLSKKNR